MRMVVAYFLRRNTKYVSIASGGYERKFYTFYDFLQYIIVVIEIVLAKAVEDPSMLIQPQPHRISTVLHDSMTIGSTLKHNIVEKLPAINTQVKLCIENSLLNDNLTFFHRRRHYLI